MFYRFCLDLIPVEFLNKKISGSGRSLNCILFEFLTNLTDMPKLVYLFYLIFCF